MMHIYHKTMSRQPQTEMDGKGEKNDNRFIVLSSFESQKS